MSQFSKTQEHHTKPTCSMWRLLFRTLRSRQHLRGEAGKGSLRAVLPQSDSGAPMQATRGASTNHVTDSPCRNPPRRSPQGHSRTPTFKLYRLKSRQALLPRTRTFPQLMFPSLHRYFACGSPRLVAPTGPRVPWAQSPDRGHQHHSQRGGGTSRQLITEADIANKDLQWHVVSHGF